MSSPVILILGAGGNIGAHTARVFAAKGFKVALMSRTKKPGDDHLQIQADLSDPQSVAAVFDQVRKVLGPPSVVVHNASAHVPNPPDDPLALSIADLERTLAVNTISVLAAAQQAIRGFAELPPSASRTFIYTGNRLNIEPIAPMLAGGIGKQATAHLIASASEAYKGKRYKFYYADQRKADGAPAYSALDGAAHAELYAELAEREGQGPWLQTFVSGEGYRAF
ncbi:hypothetical protein MMC11_005173 [Xylographa trunciseda]|nr:hypothetical protein [Xylographa trunciseda]